MCIYMCVPEGDRVVGWLVGWLVGWSSGLRLIGEGRQCVPAGRVYVFVCL